LRAPAALDASNFPHLVDMIFRSADHAALLKLRGLSRKFRERADREAGRSVLLNPSGVVASRGCLPSTSIPDQCEQLLAFSSYAKVDRKVDSDDSGKDDEDNSDEDNSDEDNSDEDNSDEDNSDEDNSDEDNSDEDNSDEDTRSRDENDSDEDDSDEDASDEDVSEEEDVCAKWLPEIRWKSPSVLESDEDSDEEYMGGTSTVIWAPKYKIPAARRLVLSLQFLDSIWYYYPGKIINRYGDGTHPKEVTVIFSPPSRWRLEPMVDHPTPFLIYHLAAWVAKGAKVLLVHWTFPGCEWDDDGDDDGECRICKRLVKLPEYRCKRSRGQGNVEFISWAEYVSRVGDETAKAHRGDRPPGWQP
jgi:hypothetical protein